MKELRGIHSDSPLSSQHGRLVFTLDIFTSSRCQISHSTWALGLALELHFWLLNSKKCGWNSSHSASHIPLLTNAHIPTFPVMVDHAEPSHLRWRCVKLCVYKMLLIEAIELHFARLCHRNSYLQTNGCKQRLQVCGRDAALCGVVVAFNRSSCVGFIVFFPQVPQCLKSAGSTPSSVARHAHQWRQLHHVHLLDTPWHREQNVQENSL